MNNVKEITIPQERYEELLQAEEVLQALREAGVDNWIGYEDAMDILDEWNKED